MKVRQFAFVCVLLLTACGDDQPPVAQPAPKPQPVGSDTLPGPDLKLEAPALPAPESLTVLEPEAEPDHAALPVKPNTQAVPKPEVISTPLDLSLPPELLENLQLGEPIPDVQSASLLPPLFVEKTAPEQTLKFGGRLLLNDEVDDDYTKSVEGAELQLEFKR